MDIIYVDANVYINFFKWEYDRWRCLGELAIMMFNRILEGEFHLAISDFLIYELKLHVDSKIVDDFLKQFKEKNLLIEVQSTEEDKNQAKEIAEHYQDPLHAILAKKAKAKYLITRDLQGFPVSCHELVEIRTPESLP